MTTTITCYRKAYPQEILFQLEPVLRKAGFNCWDIINIFQDELKKRGFEVLQVPDEVGAELETDFSCFVITDEKENPIDYHKLPDPQVMRPSEIIRRDDGSCKQGFRLHNRGWPAEEPVETLFVPDYNGFHVGELVECRFDKTENVWQPTGKTQTVTASWNEITGKSS